jgi:hypothetical protein
MDVSIEDISTVGRDADVMKDTPPRERHPDRFRDGELLYVSGTRDGTLTVISTTLVKPTARDK